MSDHLTEQQLAQYADGTLPAAELLDVGDHLADCADCRGRAAQSSGLQSAVADLRRGLQPTPDAELDHPEHEQLVAYIEDGLDAVDKEIVEGHLEFCENCAAEVAELRSFRAILSTYPAKEYEPAATPTVWQRFFAPSTTPVWRSARAYALAATVLLAAVIVWKAGGPKSPELPGAVQQVMTAQHINLDTPEIRALTGAGEPPEIGAGGPSLALGSPVATAILGDRPVFTWAVVQDADGYEVSVMDTDGHTITAHMVAGRPIWRPDAPLPLGRILRWQVKAMKNGNVVATGPPGGARFRILDAGRAAQIWADEKRYGDQPLALGILYAQAGLLDEAERALDKAAKTDPNNPVVPKLMADVKAVRQNML